MSGDVNHGKFHTIVVEPHADDAFLSLGAHIEQWTKNGMDVCIMTVYSATRKRARDAEDYARAVGASWIGLDLEEKGNARVNGAAACFIPTWVESIIKNSTQQILPLGVGGHPEHHHVQEVFLQSWPVALYYVDQPYACKLKNGADLNNRLLNRRIISMMKPGKRKWRHIPLFKDQAKFFHFNPEETLAKTFELIVS